MCSDIQAVREQNFNVIEIDLKKSIHLRRTIEPCATTGLIRAKLNCQSCTFYLGINDNESKSAVESDTNNGKIEDLR